LGAIRLVGEPTTLSRTPSRVETPTPEAGEQTEEILTELGFGDEDIAHLRATGAV
jgi:formyl-CoA transferase